MALPSIAFDPCYDIHLLRGQVIEIVNQSESYSLLQIDDRRSYNYLRNHDNVTCTFRFSFKEEDAANFGIEITRTDFSDPDSAYLVIVLLDDEPADEKNRIRNFNLIAQISDDSDDEPVETVLRIHIHNRIEEVWITPNPMTVYNGVRCSTYLRARFDDNTVSDLGTIYKGNNGDITEYRIEPQPGIQWSSPTTGLINASEGTVRGTDRTGTHQISVDVRWKLTFTATAQLVFSENLTENSPLRAELAASGHGPGPQGLAQATNILFLSDGFTIDEEYTFKIFVLEYVSDLVSKKITSPFDLLKTSINFWMVFIPSLQSGATFRGELSVEKEKKPNGFDELVGYHFPEVQPTKGIAVENWKLKHLMYRVGIPVPAEGDTNDDAVFAKLIDKWKATTRLTEEQLDWLKNDETLIREWQGYAVRCLPDAQDTALGITVNDHTAAIRDDHFKLINFDRKRIQRRHLDRFFSTLRTFVEAENREYLIGPTFVMEDANQGKDWENVVILTAARKGREANLNGYMFSKVVGKTSLTLDGKIDDVRHSIEPTELPFTMPTAVRATLTHELCHSLGLGDEYAEAPPKKFNKKPVDEAQEWPFANFPFVASGLDGYSNLQARDDLVTASVDRIDPLKIKWRYHRIQKCAVVSTLTINQNTVTLILQGQQASLFPVGKSVFLRKRQHRKTGFFLVSEGSDTTMLYSPIVDPDPVSSNFFGSVRVDEIDLPNDTVTVFSTELTESLELTLDTGRVALLEVGQTVFIETQSKNAVHTILRTGPNEYEKAVSPLLKITAVNPATRTLTLEIPTDETLLEYMQNLDAREVMIVYLPIDMPANQRTADYPHAELIALPVLKHLIDNPFPFNTNEQNREVIRDDDTTLIPSKLVPCCSRRKKEIIGFYTGGRDYHGGVYHPSARCMMNEQLTRKDKKYIELCAVCRYTLVNLIDPTQFAAFDKDYMSRKIYPG